MDTETHDRDKPNNEKPPTLPPQDIKDKDDNQDKPGNEKPPTSPPQNIGDNDKPNQNEFKTIYVNKNKIQVKENELAGEQILKYAGLDKDKYDLFLVRGQNSERILDDKQYEIKNGMQFHAILKSVPYG